MLCKHGQAHVLAPADDRRHKRHLDIHRGVGQPG
jgi:hypothetical protein